QLKTGLRDNYLEKRRCVAGPHGGEASLSTPAIKTYRRLDGQNKIKQSSAGGNRYQQKSERKDEER
ncbi:MAG: hypothetical protein ACRC16_16925, partial [Aeromonas salmonicida]